MASGSTRWKPLAFGSEFRAWVARAGPPHETRATVFAWALARLDDPYEGAVRVTDFDNLWRARIPGTANGAGESVYCVYFVRELESEIDCRGFEFNSW